MSFALVVLTAIAVIAALLVRRAAARAYASERRYRALAAHSPDQAIMLVDQRLTFVLFEGKALERQGWVSAEVTGRPVADVVPPDRMEELRPHLEAALAGVTGRLEWASVRSDAIFRVDVAPFREHDDGPIRSRPIVSNRTMIDPLPYGLSLHEEATSPTARGAFIDSRP